MKTTMLRALDRSRGNRGNAMVTVLVLLFVVMCMAYAFFHKTIAEQRTAHANLDERRAFFLAEAGLHEGIEALRSGKSGKVGKAPPDEPEFDPALLGGGVLWVTNHDDVGADNTRLVSTAMVGQGRCALEAVIHVKPDDPPLFTSTLNSKDTLTLN